MSFLEALANPVATKDINADAVGEGSSGKQEKVTTTPLVQFLKEKKASKNKEAAVKAAKKQEAKGKASSSSPEDTKKKGKEAKVEKSVERAAKEAVKILNREAAKTAAEQPSAAPATASTEAGSDVPKLDFLAHVPPRHRSAATAAHIRMLQRDLGFSPAQAHRQVRRDTADAQKAERVAAKEKAAAELKEPTSSQAAQAPAVPTAPKSAQSNRKSRNKGISTESESSKASNPAGPSKSAAASSSNTTASGPSTPVILLRKPEATASTPKAPPPQAPKAQPVVLARKPQPVSVPSDGATQAFVKHANASQGVTEPLLKEAMEKFGAVSHVEIDRRKGFAYVDFIDTEGLKKAMAANPISVGQGTVQVLQRKGTALAPEKKPPSNPQNNASRGGRGARGGGSLGRRGGRGGARGGGVAAAEASKAPSAPSGPATK
jgi:regulator of nonsense transcripts 3